MVMKAQPREAVWKKVRKSGDNECWEWQGLKTKWGYGEISINKVHYRAHRLVYEVSNNLVLRRDRRQSSESQIVMHSCDNPGCCNPRHLFLGTPKANTRDMMRKGRRANFEGERGQHAKLTNAQAEEIRQLCRLKVPQKEIALKYGVSVPTVSGIKWNRVYKVHDEGTISVGV
jgi:DNA-binding CsgD family transcriptional regulator